MKLAGMYIRSYLASPSVIFILLFFVLVSLIRFHFDPVNIISWDNFGYYLYLPSYFIYHDPTFSDLGWVRHVAEQYNATLTLYQLREVPGGTYVNYYTMGMAIAYAPAFLVGHLLALALQYPADGFSLPYQYAIAVEGLMALLASLLLLRKVLLHFFNEKITLLVLVAITLGTNFLEMAYGNFHSPHGFIFLASAAILWFTMRWHAEQKLKFAIFLGLLIGWACLTRPVEIVSLAIPFLYGIGSQYSLIGKFRFFFRNKLSLLLFGISLMIMVFPQFLYWKSMTGSWFYNTYLTGSEGMDLLSPHTLDFLFSFRKGWLVYTPVMVFALAGLVFVFRKQKALFWPFLVYLFFFIYFYSSWTIWWYAFCFSQRVMIHAYPVLAILLGFTLMTFAGSRKLWRIPAFCMIGFLILLNLFQTWQYTFAKVLDGARMTPAYYWRTFGSTTATDDDRKLLLIDRSNSEEDSFSDTTAYVKRNLGSYDFEQKEAWFAYQDSNCFFRGRYAMKMDSSSIYTVPFRYCYRELTDKDHAWLRFTFFVFPVSEPEKDPFSLVVAMQHGKDYPSYKYRTANIENAGFNVEKGKWNKVVFDYLTPEVRSVKDTLSVYFWHRGKMPVYIDELSIDVFSAKP